MIHPSLIETLTLPHLSRPNTRKTSGTPRTDIDRFHIRNQKSHIRTRNTTLINEGDDYYNQIYTKGTYDCQHYTLHNSNYLTL